MMNKLREYLLRAGNDLGVTVIVPFILVLRNGSKLSADALLPELGAPKGTIICRSSDEYRHISNELKAEGYTCSSFSEPLSDEEYDVESYKEMFLDWGWTSEKKPKPEWMN